MNVRTFNSLKKEIFTLFRLENPDVHQQERYKNNKIYNNAIQDVIKILDGYKPVKLTKEQPCELHQTYSQGKSKPVLSFEFVEEAWHEAKKYAMDEAEKISIKQNSDVSIQFDKEDHMITLYNPNNNIFLYYTIVINE